MHRCHNGTVKRSPCTGTCIDDVPAEDIIESAPLSCACQQEPYVLLSYVSKLHCFAGTYTEDIPLEESSESASFLSRASVSSVDSATTSLLCQSPDSCATSSSPAKAASSEDQEISQNEPAAPLMWTQWLKTLAGTLLPISREKQD